MGTLGATGIGSDIDAALRLGDLVNSRPLIDGVIEPMFNPGRAFLRSPANTCGLDY